MSVYVTKVFARFARKAGLQDVALLHAAWAVAEGRYDADLGGGVFKQRIARDGSGKSGGFRTILLFRDGGHCIFAHGFAKNAKANISPAELAALKRLAIVLLGLEDDAMAAATNAGELVKVSDNDEGDRR